VRVDSGITSGLEVSIDYDPMLAKIISWGEHREEARRRLEQALGDTAVLGFHTNIEFLRQLVARPEVIAGELDTGLIGRLQDEMVYASAGEREFTEAALLLDAWRAVAPSGRTSSSPWTRRDGWRLGPSAPQTYRLQSGDSPISVVEVSGEHLTDASMRRLDDHTFVTTVGGKSRRVTAIAHDRGVILAYEGTVFTIAEAAATHGDSDAHSTAPNLDSPMPGAVAATHVEDGARVQAGDQVLSVEAMKMEHVLRAEIAGTVRLLVSVGEQVTRGQTLAIIEPEEAE